MSILISSRHLFVHFVLPFSIKGSPWSPLLLTFLFSVDKSIGSGHILSFNGAKCENRTIILNLLFILAEIHNKMEQVYTLLVKDK